MHKFSVATSVRLTFIVKANSLQEAQELVTELKNKDNIKIYAEPNMLEAEIEGFKSTNVQPTRS